MGCNQTPVITVTRANHFKASPLNPTITTLIIISLVTNSRDWFCKIVDGSFVSGDCFEINLTAILQAILHIVKITIFKNDCYSLSCKTMNTRENFWNVYCFTTNQMRDETAKDNGQTATGISHDLMQNNKLAFFSMRNLQFSLCISLKKLFFCHKPTLVTWFRLFKNQTTELT